MREAWGKFYAYWGLLMMTISNVFAEWSRDSYYRSGKLYYQEALELVDVIKGLTNFDDAVGLERVAVFGHPAVGESRVLGVRFDALEDFEIPHGDEAPS